MRFRANENIPLASVRLLRAANLDVAAIIEDMPGASDNAVLARAASEHLVILSFDRDYGELIYRRKLPIPAGVAYFRFDPATPGEPAEHLLQLLSMPSIALEGFFTVVDRDRFRQRPL